MAEIAGNIEEDGVFTNVRGEVTHPLQGMDDENEMRVV
jgi:hypothetical protein